MGDLGRPRRHWSPALPILLIIILLGGLTAAEYRVVNDAVTTTAPQSTVDAVAPATCPWVTDPVLTTAQRVAEIEARMTKTQLAELLRLHDVTSTDSYEGWTPAEPAVCMPSLTEDDARIGLHSFGWDDRSTLLPAPITVAASFDSALASSVGQLIGSQAQSQGVDFASDPMVNLPRGSDFGRTSESLSEDPLLAATLGAQEVAGIQSQGVGAILQHLGVYSQAQGRAAPGKSDSIVSQTAMAEVYLAPFEAIVEAAAPAGVMMAYTSSNGVQAVDNANFHTDLEQWSDGNPPFTRSDCLLVPDDPAAMIASGLSQTKCGPNYALASMLTLTKATLERLATPLLTAAFALNLIQQPLRGRPGDVSVAQQAQGQAVAGAVSEDGIVLLKNAGGILPLSQSRTVALIGTDEFPESQGGLAVPVPTGSVGDAQGLAAAWGSRLTYVPIPASAAPAGPNNPSGESITPAVIAQAVAAARHSHTAIVVASELSSEWWDHATLALPPAEVQLIDAVAGVNPRTIVVANDGGAFLTTGWGSRVRGIVDQWYPGEEAGTALAAILDGAVNPSGKLPITFPTSDAAQPAEAGTPQMDPVGDPGPVEFSEGVDIGYRWYLQHHVTPAYPFGYGLSYSSFHVTSARATVGIRDAVTVTATVTNTSARPGTDVIQAYLTRQPIKGQPVRLLAFGRVTVPAHGSNTVTLQVSAGDLSRWVPSRTTWFVAAGRYQLAIGDSVESLPRSVTVRLGGIYSGLHGITVAG
jgi:beta-glucosidase